MITPHDAVRQYMLCNTAGTMPRSNKNKPQKVADMHPGNRFRLMAGLPLLPDAIKAHLDFDEAIARHIAQSEVPKRRGRPPGKHNLRSRGRLLEPWKPKGKCCKICELEKRADFLIYRDDGTTMCQPCTKAQEEVDAIMWDADITLADLF